VVQGDVIELPSIHLPSDKVSVGMADFAGNDAFVVGNILLTEAPPFQRKVTGFYLDTTEVTLGQWLSVFENIPAFLNGQAPVPQDFALPWVSYDEALSYAETLGKRLPTEFEYECAATMNGTTKYPWGNQTDKLIGWQFGPSGSPDFDQTATQPPVYGLYSNLGEWTMSRFTLYPEHQEFQLHQPNSEDLRVIRGAPQAVIIGQGTAEDWQRGPRTRLSHDRHSGTATVGFRCARSTKPRLNPEDF
jgi:formylglycine-generating enzyme required for sulfatase activity